MMTSNPLLVIILILVSIACVILAAYVLRNSGLSRIWKPVSKKATGNAPVIQDGSSAGTQKTQTDAEIEKLITDRRMLRAERSAGFCPKCGRAVQQSDMYCPGCGEKVC